MDSSNASDADLWYADGLRFGCTRCGRCCGGAPGHIWVDEQERERIAAFLMLPLRQFAARYCRRVWWRISLREQENGDCILLGPQGCTIYPVRPAQCASFPFWAHVLQSRQRWEALKRRCPGVGQGRLYRREEIQRITAGERTT